MNKHDEEQRIRKIMNQPKVKDAIEEAYLDSLVYGVEKIDVDELIGDE